MDASRTRSTNPRAGRDQRPTAPRRAGARRPGRRSPTNQQQDRCGDRAPQRRHGPDRSRHGPQRGRHQVTITLTATPKPQTWSAAWALPRALRRRRPITMIVRGLTHHRVVRPRDRLGSSPLDQPPARVTVQSAGRAHWRRIGGLPGGCQTGLGRLFPTWSPGQWPSCWPSWPAAPSIWPNSAPASRRPPSKPPTAESARRSPRPALDGAVVLGRATGRLMGGLLSFRSQGDGTVGL